MFAIAFGAYVSFTRLQKAGIPVVQTRAQDASLRQSDDTMRARGAGFA
jgi:hypothetical protein